MSSWNRVSTTAERLREALDNSMMKQSELARATGLDKGSIHHYLTGRYEPKSGAISKMASVLGVSEMWLWGYDIPMEDNKKISIDKVILTEGEKVLLDLFRKVPDDQQRLVLQMIRAALNNQEQ